MELTNKTCVVTGAGGFIGERLCLALAGKGARVVALLRSRHGMAGLEAAGCQARVVRMGDAEALLRQVPKADLLFNFAYDMRAGYAANMAAFEGLMSWAERAGVGRIVHASSAVVYDDWPAGELDETSPVTQTGRHGYRGAKIAMEDALRAGPAPAAILQPTIVYGPGGKIWTQIPIAALKAGGVVLPAENGRCPAVHVDDVVDAALLAAEREATGRFLVSGADSLSWGEFYRGYADAIGTGEVILKPFVELDAALGPAGEDEDQAAPGAAARVSALLRRLIGHRRFEAMLAALGGMRQGKRHSFPDRAGLELFMGDTKVDSAKAHEALGFSARRSFLGTVEQIVSDMDNS